MHTQKQPLTEAQLIALHKAASAAYGRRGRGKRKTMSQAALRQRKRAARRPRPNARLSAPELLAALQGLLTACDGQLDEGANHEGLNNCERMAKARAAISKATGGDK